MNRSKLESTEPINRFLCFNEMLYIYIFKQKNELLELSLKIIIIYILNYSDDSMDEFQQKITKGLI
jgi:hypothetical protein